MLLNVESLYNSFFTYLPDLDKVLVGHIHLPVGIQLAVKADHLKSERVKSNAVWD